MSIFIWKFLLLLSLKFQLVSGKMMVTLEDDSSFGSSTLRMIYRLPKAVGFQPSLAQASTKELFDIEGIWKTRFMRSLAAMDRHYRPVVLVYFWWSIFQCSIWPNFVTTSHDRKPKGKASFSGFSPTKVVARKPQSLIGVLRQCWWDITVKHGVAVQQYMFCLYIYILYLYYYRFHHQGDISPWHPL